MKETLHQMTNGQLCKGGFLCCLLLYSFQILATDCSERYYIESHVNLALCQNSSSYNQSTALLYEARTKALNHYILIKIESGELENKVFEIAIYDRMLSQPQLYLSQNKRSYHILISGYPDINRLIFLVDMFCQPNFKGLEIEWGIEQTEEGYNLMMKHFDHLYAQESSIEGTDILKDFTCVIWKKDKLEIRYRADEIFYNLEGKDLPYKINLSLPCKIKDRFILMEGVENYENIHFYVYEDSQLIKKHKATPNLILYSISNVMAKISVNWVDFMQFSDHCIYSYSYAKNRFYDLTADSKRKL